MIIAFIIVTVIMRVILSTHYSFHALTLLSHLIIVKCANLPSDDFKSAMEYSLIKSSNVQQHENLSEFVNVECLTNCISHRAQSINMLWKVISQTEFDKWTVNDTETTSSCPCMDAVNSNSSSEASLRQQIETFKTSKLPQINDADQVLESMNNWSFLTKWELRPSIKPSEDPFPNFRYFKDVFLVPAAMFYCILDHHRKTNEL